MGNFRLSDRVVRNERPRLDPELFLTSEHHAASPPPRRVALSRSEIHRRTSSRRYTTRRPRVKLAGPISECRQYRRVPTGTPVICDTCFAPRSSISFLLNHDGLNGANGDTRLVDVSTTTATLARRSCVLGAIRRACLLRGTVCGVSAASPMRTLRRTPQGRQASLIFAALGVLNVAVTSSGYGGDMGKDLDVDAGGLTSAAADSVAVAADVVTDGFDGPVSDRPSGAGIAAFEAASATARTRVSGRIAGQASDVAAAGDRYDATDGGSADAIAVTM